MTGADIDFDCSLLFAKICTGMKKIIRSQKGKAGWDLEEYMLDRSCKIL